MDVRHELVTIRPATREDSAQLLKLMNGLAEFEGCIDAFRVSEAEIVKRGFPEEGEPEFYALVAEKGNQLIGMLVYYFIPFTFDLRPSLFIKELFVRKTARGEGTGEGLFEAAKEEAINKGCGRIKWDVLQNNLAAQRFYERQGARQDKQWLGFVLDL